MIISTLAFSQKENYCLFGYISDDDDFQEVTEYVESLGCNVISTCKVERLIFVKLTKNYKDYSVLFKNIEIRFYGKCYYKSNIDNIINYRNCREIYIKEKLKNKKE